MDSAWTIVKAMAEWEAEFLPDVFNPSVYDSFGYYIRHFCNQKCTDERDRIYALLSLNPISGLPSPDYGQTVIETYTSFARHFLCYPDLQVLYDAGYIAESGYLRTIPHTKG